MSRKQRIKEDGTIFKRLEKRGWKKMGEGHTYAHYRKGPWFASICLRTTGIDLFTRTGVPR